MSIVRLMLLRCAAVTAGVIASDIGAKNVCDVQRYYDSNSAYSSMADAIKHRMEVPTTVSKPRSPLKSAATCRLTA